MFIAARDSITEMTYFPGLCILKSLFTASGNEATVGLCAVLNAYAAALCDVRNAVLVDKISMETIHTIRRAVKERGEREREGEISGIKFSKCLSVIRSYL